MKVADYLNNSSLTFPSIPIGFVDSSLDKRTTEGAEGTEEESEVISHDLGLLNYFLCLELSSFVNHVSQESKHCRLSRSDKENQRSFS